MTGWETAKTAKIDAPDLIVYARGVYAETIARNPYIPFPPHPKQLVFLTAPVRERMYGGAAGGGKSAALLAFAVQYAHVPGHAALLLRRTYKDLTLPGALMSLADEWFRPTDAEWSEKDKTWYFPCKDGFSTLTFGYLAAEKDKYQYQSSAFHTIGFDELTQFSETQYTYMFTRCRRRKGVAAGPSADIPLRVGSATNPGGVGHFWVRQRFVVNAREAAKTGDRVGKGGRLFVPAKLSDNPGIDAESYRENLSVLDHVTRMQMEEGDWDVRPDGNLFKRHWFTSHGFIPRSEVPPLVGKVRYWDLAATEKNEMEEGHDPDWSVGLLMGRDSHGMVYVLEIERFRGTPMEVERRMQVCAKRDGKGTPVWVEQEPGAAGKSMVSNIRRRVLRGYEVRADRVTGKKKDRARPVSAAVEQGDVRLVDGPWIEDFLDEVTAFPEVSHDDQVDAFSGAFSVSGEESDLDDAGGVEGWGDTFGAPAKSAGDMEEEEGTRGEMIVKKSKNRFWNEEGMLESEELEEE